MEVTSLVLALSVALAFALYAIRGVKKGMDYYDQGWER